MNVRTVEQSINLEGHSVWVLLLNASRLQYACMHTFIGEYNVSNADNGSGIFGLEMVITLERAFIDVLLRKKVLKYKKIKNVPSER